MTIQSVLKQVGDDLAGVSDAPELDAERIIGNVLKKDTAWLIAHGSEKISDQHEKEISVLVSRRKKGEPLAYILGAWDFYGRTFMVTPDVLVPRPATEHLIDTALPVISNLSKKLQRPIRVADIGTGSGCIGITLLLESPHITQVIATDLSEAALNVAQHNAHTFGVADKMLFLQGNMLEPIQNKSVDLIVSNPPYVPSEELRNPSSLTTAGLAYEPQSALDGGSDGLTYVNQLLTSSIPIVIETVEGEIISQNIDSEL